MINHPGQEGKSAGKLVGAAPIVKQAIALVSIVMLQTQGSWSPTGSKPEEIQLKVTGGELYSNLSWNRQPAKMETEC